MRISDWSSDVCSSDLRRLKAARVRAAREREERVAAALDKLAELEAERARRSKTNKAEVAKQKEPRASTSDPQARVMKMADGGFRTARSEEHTSELQSLMRISYAVFSLHKNTTRSRCP